MQVSSTVTTFLWIFIRSFVSVEWYTGMADEDWNGITVHERLHESSDEIPRWSRNSPNKPPPPHNNQVKVKALSVNGDLDKLNPQFKDMIHQ